ncbi:MAG TPA: M14 family zinc carboxypeptidase, partial [Vicinamibacterales bacterium]|nr:M14 family zinc carboxypeptidase [Vicinamibacterales bacterium]
MSDRTGLHSTTGVFVLLVVALVATAAVQRGEPAPIAPQEAARIWDAEHVSPPLPPLVDHAEVVQRLEGLSRSAPDLFTVEKIGESIEGRSINHVRLGAGDFRVLLWSQMHGDESTATSALFDLFEYFRRHRDEPVVRRMLTRLTLHVVPMLNPDGAERFERRNAQSIDINRDALRLQTPEGRILKALRDRLSPRVGFNLHNQSWRTSVGDPPKPASISLLSVAYDEAVTENAGRLMTKRICAVIRDALEPFASGQIGRYDEEFEVRAFGDNITLWGTPVVLIETGPWPAETPDPALVRLNFIALVSALDAIASGRVNRADPRRYESLPVNESRNLYVLVRNATVITGAGIPPFVADIGVTASRRVRIVDGRRELVISTEIDDIGDLRTFGAIRTIDATGMTVV